MRQGTCALALVVTAVVSASCVHEHKGAGTELGPPGRPPGSPCFEGQVRIEGFCIDKYEAYVVEVDAEGREQPHSPYDVIGDKRVRAKVARDVVPQAYIRACRGPNKNDLYPYGGMQRRPGLCNEGKGSFVMQAFGQDVFKLTYENFNDPKLDQMPNGLAHTGSFPRCASPDGVFDLVGNLHEWVDEGPDANGHGRFRGGWYGDAENNGPGCFYVTSAHEVTYHDYSTGFRCCADAAVGR